MTTRWEMTLELRRRFALERLGDDAGLVKSDGKPPHSKGSGRRVLGGAGLRHDTALVQAIDLKKPRRDGLAGGAQDAKQSAKRSAGAVTSPEQQGVARVPAAVVDVYCFPRLAVAGGFEEEPDAALALVDPVFEQAGAGYVVVFGG
jgi:hypothetical protein